MNSYLCLGISKSSSSHSYGLWIQLYLTRLTLNSFLTCLLSVWTDLKETFENFKHRRTKLKISNLEGLN